MYIYHKQRRISLDIYHEILILLTQDHVCFLFPELYRYYDVSSHSTVSGHHINYSLYYFFEKYLDTMRTFLIFIQNGTLIEIKGWLVILLQWMIQLSDFVSKFIGANSQTVESAWSSPWVVLLQLYIYARWSNRRERPGPHALMDNTRALTKKIFRHDCGYNAYISGAVPSGAWQSDVVTIFPDIVF